LKAKSSCEVRPGWMMSDKSPIAHACDPFTQFPSKLVQLPQVRSLIGSVLRRMGRIYLNERFRDMPHHSHRILMVQPYVSISSLISFASRRPADLRYHAAMQCDLRGR